MKKKNWKFEALARAKIIRQEEDAKIRKHTPHIEDFKPAKEIERLQKINTDLLEACKRMLPWIGKMIADGTHLKCVKPTDAENTLILAQQAIAKAEGRQP